MKKKDDDEHSFTGDDKSVSYSDDRCLKGSQRDVVVVKEDNHTHIFFLFRMKNRYLHS